MLEDQYEMTEDLLSPQSGGADALPPQKLRPTKQQLKNRTKIILIILAAAIAIGAMFAYRAYAHSQYEKKLDLAEKYMDEGKTAQAKLAFEDAAQIEKRNPEPYIEMGKMYFDNGDYDQAIKYLTSANQRQETSESYYKIADSYEEKGNSTKAEENQKKAEAISKTETKRHSVFSVKRNNSSVSGASNAGNTNGNLTYSGTASDSSYAPGGRMVHAGDWTYYSTENGLYRTDGSKVKQLSDDVYTSLNVYKGKFYVLETDDDEQTVESMNLDAENEKEIYSTSDQDIAEVLVYKDKVYVIQVDSGEGTDWQEGGNNFGPTTRVTAMNLDGSNQKKILSASNSNGQISIDSDRLYYFDAENFVIRSVNLTGGDDQLALDVKNLNDSYGTDTMPSFYVDNQHVYYTALLNTYVDYNLKTKDKVVFQSDDWQHTYILNKDPNGKYVYVISYEESGSSSYDTDEDYDYDDDSDSYDSDDDTYDDEDTYDEDDDYDYDGYSFLSTSSPYTLWRVDADGTNVTKLYTSDSGDGSVGFVYANDNGVFIMENNGTVKSISSNGSATELETDD